MVSSPHHDVAAYALGVLDDGDNEAFERRLMGCEECQIELREPSEVPGPLDALRRDRSNTMDEDRTPH